MKIYPKQGDYVKMEGENFTIVQTWLFDLFCDLFVIRDNQGEDWLITRNKNYDTNLQNGWELVSR